MEELESIVAIKERLCKAGRKAAEELIKIAEEPIINGRLSDDGDGLSSDKLTRAAQAKKIAVMDAFEILTKVETEENAINAGKEGAVTSPTKNWAEKRAKR